MESGDVIYIMEDQKNSEIVGFLSGRAVYQQNPVIGIWLYKKDIAAIAKKIETVSISTCTRFIFLCEAHNQGGFYEQDLSEKSEPYWLQNF